MSEEKNLQGLEKITGSVEGIIYQNEENGYAILDFGTQEDELITVVGTLPYVAAGDTLTLYGKWVHNPKYGRQFRADQFEKEMPADATAILRYLSSRTVKGIGPKKAQKIVDLFGEDTFDVIENHPEWLTQISGITQKGAMEISEEFKKQAGVRRVMMFFRDYFGATLSVRIFKTWGNDAVEKAKENPYLLCEEPCALPFDKVDAMAASFGYDMYSERRILGGARYILSYNASTNGHTCLPFEKLALATSQSLEIEPEHAGKMIERFIHNGELSEYRADDVRYVMTNEVASAETLIATKLSELSYTAESLRGMDIAAVIEKVESESGLVYAQGQRTALFEALSRGVLVLTGGPGTGKTTVVKALVSIFSSLNMKTVLAAPTGRAAKRLSEATSREAKTIHRMLEMEKSESGALTFNRNARNPISERVVIIDESSMIDLELLSALLCALGRGTRLILIGDTDQLPSVGAGNVLADIIASRCIKTVSLNEIFRQSSESMIVINAHKINLGERPNLGSVDGDFFFVGRANERDIPETVSSLVLDRLPKKYGRDVAEGIQVITPSKKGYGGVDVLNAELQERINPAAKFKRERLAHGVCFREGDRVMQTVNNYELLWEKNGIEGLGIFNGDIGIIESIDSRAEYMTIRFDDRVVEYPFDHLDELELAYAITVHKSQGSEYPIVIIPIYSCAPMLKTRNLLYTAVTRAKRMVILVGRPEIVYEMVANNREFHRYTTLRGRIGDYI